MASTCHCSRGGRSGLGIFGGFQGCESCGLAPLMVSLLSGPPALPIGGKAPKGACFTETTVRHKGLGPSGL